MSIIVNEKQEPGEVDVVFIVCRSSLFGVKLCIHVNHMVNVNWKPRDDRTMCSLSRCMDERR